MKYKINKVFVIIITVFIVECFQPEKEPGLFTVSFISLIDTLDLSNLFIVAHVYDRNDKLIKIEIDSADYFVKEKNIPISNKNGTIPATHYIEYYKDPLRFDCYLLDSNLDTISYGNIEIKHLGGLGLILIYIAKTYDKSEPNLKKYLVENQAVNHKFYYQSFSILNSDTQNVATDSLFIIYRKYVSQRFK